MPVLALLAAAFLAQDAPPAPTVTAQDQTVPLTFPSGGPYNAQTPSVNAGGARIAVGQDGTWERPFLIDGGWEDFKELYSRVDQSHVRAPYRLRIVVFDYATVLQRSPAGVVRQHRSLIDGTDLAALQSGLAIFRAMVEGSLAGKVEVKLDVQTDGDPIIVETESDKTELAQPARFDLGTDASTLPAGPFGATFVFQDVFPTFNNDAFETDDKVYRGPYAGVFVVHAGLTGQITTHLAGNTPVSVIPYFRTGQRPAAEALAANLYECWKRQITVRSAGAVGAQTPIDVESVPHPWTGPWLEKLVLEPGDGSVWKQGTESGNVCSNSDGEVAVRAELADAVASQFGTMARAAGWSVSPNGVYARFRPTGTTVDALIATVSGGPKRVVAATVPVVGEALGDVECAPVTGTSPGSAFAVKVKGRVARGFARLLAGDRQRGADYLNAQVKLSTDDNLALLVRGQDGQVLATVLIGGDTAGPSERPDRKDLFEADVPADDQFHPVSVPVGSAIGDRAVADVILTSADPGGCERSSRGAVTVQIAGLAFSDKPLDTARPEQAANLALAIAKVGENRTAQESADLKAAMASMDATVKLTALSVLSRIKSPESTPALAESLRSASVPIAFLAARALAFQGTTEALAELRSTVERGPFDHNRWFAAEQLAPLADPAMVSSLNFMTVRNRRARTASVRALTGVKAPMAGVVLSAMLMMEPNPIVKTEIARLADTGIDLLARRMLFVAVNDPSEVVRGSSYGRLIDCQDAGIQSEALKGVKDDSPTVRVYLLDLMRQRAKEQYRPALRTAVVDSDPRVRAMALRAFSTQPGPVDPDEVRNTFADPDPTVRKALEELAKAKGFKVPVP